jgi:hypothetical protein
LRWFEASQKLWTLIFPETQRFKVGSDLVGCGRPPLCKSVRAGLSGRGFRGRGGSSPTPGDPTRVSADLRVRFEALDSSIVMWVGGAAGLLCLPRWAVARSEKPVTWVWNRSSLDQLRSHEGGWEGGVTCSRSLRPAFRVLRRLLCSRCWGDPNPGSQYNS